MRRRRIGKPSGSDPEESRFESSRLSVPYKDKKRQSEYVVAFRKKRRDAWFAENGPCAACGSWDDLELDHKDRTTKVTHGVWGWSQKRRDEELAKCQALCATCHREKSSVDISEAVTGAWQDPKYRAVQMARKTPEYAARIAQAVRNIPSKPCETCGKMFKPAGLGVHRKTCKG